MDGGRHGGSSKAGGEPERIDRHGMDLRGVTRPGAERRIRRARVGRGAPPAGAEREARLHRLRLHHEQTLWVYWTLILLGLWLIAAPASLGYGHEDLWGRPSGGRGAWFGDDPRTALRAALTTWSDVLGGILLVIFGWRSLTPNRPFSLWGCAFVGIWLTLAPIVLWAPTAAAYLNDTLVGALVIALAVLIPGMPNMILYMKMGPPTPPGWSYNPSSWPQRWIMIALGFAGWLVSRYLAAYQLGYIDSTWDPFFGAGSERVLNSDLSHTWPVSDAALGAAAYTLEFLMGWMGSPARWRTMPWMVTFFGILVIPLGLIHIALVVSQPVVVGAWCTFCLLAAAIMLPMIPLEVDEVVAMGQHLFQSKRRGTSLWEAFWKGGPAEGATHDERTPPIRELPQRPRAVLGASLWGMSYPWTLVLSAAIGVALMALPGALGVDARAADVNHLAGALIVVASVVAMGEVVRATRLVNVALGLVVAIAPWVVAGAPPAARLAASLLGLAATALALPRGPKTERYGLWDPLVF